MSGSQILAVSYGYAIVRRRWEHKIKQDFGDALEGLLWTCFPRTRIFSVAEAFDFEQSKPFAIPCRDLTGVAVRKEAIEADPKILTFLLFF